jgi:hypothetical protein
MFRLVSSTICIAKLATKCKSFSNCIGGCEAMFIGGYQVVFEGCFKNTNTDHMVTCLSDNIGHRLWLQSPFNHLGGERKVNYFAEVFRDILKILYV